MLLVVVLFSVFAKPILLSEGESAMTYYLGCNISLFEQKRIMYFFSLSEGPGRQHNRIPPLERSLFLIFRPTVIVSPLVGKV